MADADPGAPDETHPDGFDPDAALGWTLVRTQQAMRARFQALVAEMGLSAHELGVLTHLRRTPGVSQASLAREVHVTPQSMGPIVTGLVDAGLVRRHPASPGRPARLELTPAGVERERAAGSLAAREDDPASLGLSADERDDLVRLLHRVREHLEREVRGT